MTILSTISGNQKILIENCFSQGSVVARTRNLGKLVQVKRLRKEYKRIAKKQRAGSITASYKK